MSENEFKSDQPPSEGTPKPYEQLPDEPDKWFDRFQRYCQMGPSRDLLRLYRQVMHERDDRQAAASGEPSSESLTGVGSPVRHLSGAWRQKVKEFNWDERALTWDDDRRQMAFK